MSPIETLLSTTHTITTREASDITTDAEVMVLLIRKSNMTKQTGSVCRSAVEALDVLDKLM